MTMFDSPIVSSIRGSQDHTIIARRMTMVCIGKRNRQEFTGRSAGLVDPGLSGIGCSQDGAA
jgi:hypothetical protein